MQPLRRTLTAPEMHRIRIVPLRVYAQAQLNQVAGQCLLMRSAVDEPVEYAFYLLVAGRKTLVSWYENSPVHTFSSRQKRMESSYSCRVLCDQRRCQIAKYLQPVVG